MNLEQIRNILITRSYLSWHGDNYVNFINFLGEIDIEQLDIDTRNIAYALLEQDRNLIRAKEDTVKLLLPTREEQNKSLEPKKSEDAKIIVVSLMLVIITVVLFIFGLI